MRFTKLYEELKFDDVFPVASEKDLVARKAQYVDIKLKEIIDAAEKTKLPDGTWHIHDDLNLFTGGLTSLNKSNVSIVDGSFDCSDNKLTSLEGCPKIGKGFYCYYNALTSLEGCPTTINGNFWCNINSLTSLKGCPTIIKGSFDCSHNQITSLEGCPTQVDSDFICAENTKKFTIAEIRAICKVKGHIIT